MIRKLLMSLAILAAIGFAGVSSAEAGCYRGRGYYPAYRGGYYGPRPVYSRYYRPAVYPAYYGGPVYRGGYYPRYRSGVSFSFGF